MQHHDNSNRSGLVPADTSGIETRQILGLRLHAITEDHMVEICGSAIEERRRLCIGVVNAAKIVNMKNSPLLRDSVTQSDMVAADGMSVVWASKVLGSPLPGRVNGTNLFEKLLNLANEKSYGVYLLGAREEVLDELCRRIKAKYATLRIVGHRNGYFDESDSKCIADDISQSGADMLFVGITSPKKEIFMAEHGSALNVPIVHGVGGSFDVLAGVVKRAPVSWQNAGFEWLYRVIQEPRRMWKRYLITNSKFILLVLAELLSRKSGRQA